MKLINSAVALGLAGLGVVSQVSTATALTWNWSYTGSGINASGQWISDGTTYDPTQNTTYTIQSISGTRNGTNITGLSTIGGADQKFRWNGTNILTNINGFAYTVSSGDPNEFKPYCLNCSGNFGNISNELHQYVAEGSQITSSSLSPAAVPGK